MAGVPGKPRRPGGRIQLRIPMEQWAAEIAGSRKTRRAPHVQRQYMRVISGVFSNAARAGFPDHVVDYVNAKAAKSLGRPPTDPLEAARHSGLALIELAVFFREWARENGKSSEEALRLVNECRGIP